MACQQYLMTLGKPYPLTCEDCGLGPCKHNTSSQITKRLDCTDEQLIEEVRRRGFVIKDAQIHISLTDNDVHDAFNYVEFVKGLDFDRDREEWCKAFAASCEAKLRKKNNGNAERASAAVLEEREACAKVCEEWLHGDWHNQGVIAAAMIRARSEK